MKKHNPKSEDKSTKLGGNWFGGMKKHNPSPDDKSTVLHGGSVNSGAERGSTAATPRTIGPRDA